MTTHFIPASYALSQGGGYTITATTSLNMNDYASTQTVDALKAEVAKLKLEQKESLATHVLQRTLLDNPAIKMLAALGEEMEVHKAKAASSGEECSVLKAKVATLETALAKSEEARNALSLEVSRLESEYAEMNTQFENVRDYVCNRVVSARRSVVSAETASPSSPPQQQSPLVFTKTVPFRDPLVE